MVLPAARRQSSVPAEPTLGDAVRTTFAIAFAVVLVGSLSALLPSSAAAEPELSWSTEASLPVADARQALAAPPWGACGVGTEESKVVRTFTGSQRREWVLRCGGPKYSNEPTWGYRHILWRHRGDFERMAAGTNQNWRDVADLSLDAIAKDPDRWSDAGGGKSCRSRLVYLVNKNTGQVVRRQIVKQISVFKGANSSDIITAYPTSAQC